MKEIATLIWLFGILLGSAGLIMLYVNYKMGRPTKKSWVIATLGAVLVFTIVILEDIGKI